MGVIARTMEDNWGDDFPVVALPSDGDLAAIRELVAALPPCQPRERASAVAEKGLLRDFAPCYATAILGRPDSCAARRIPHLRLFLDCFDTVAELLGYGEGGDADNGPGPELHVKNSRIDVCDVSYADIRWPVRFEHCTWPNVAEFVGAHFRKIASFLGCSFRSEAHFFAATFDSDVFFGGAAFHRVADFRGANFDGEVSFFRGNFRESLELRYAEFTETSTINVHELRFQGSTSLGGSLHLHLHQMRKGSWPRYQGRIVGEKSKNPRDLADACDQYGELEANFSAQGSPDAAGARDWCHYRYMDLRRKTRCGRWSPRRLFDWLFMKWCFGYGIFARRIIFTAITVILIFATIYATNCFGLSEDTWAIQHSNLANGGMLSHGNWSERIADGLYFSAITFATVGYGDLYPLHWAKCAGALEGVLGVFIMSVFTVSFARKLLR